METKNKNSIFNLFNQITVKDSFELAEAYTSCTISNLFKNHNGSTKGIPIGQFNSLEEITDFIKNDLANKGQFIKDIDYIPLNQEIIWLDVSYKLDARNETTSYFIVKTVLQ